MRSRSSHAGQFFTHDCLYAQTAVHASKIYAPDDYFHYGKPEDPQLEPHSGIKMAQVQGSLVYICGSEKKIVALPLAGHSLNKYDII